MSEVVTFTVDGESLDALEGQTVASALLAAGLKATRWTARYGEPRGVYCGMGVCYECLVVVHGRRNVRGCMTPVREGLVVETQTETGPAT